MTIFSSKKPAIISAVVIVVAGVTVVYGYSTGSDNALASTLKKILPAVIMDGNTLSIRDVEENLQILKRLESDVSAGFAFDQLIKRTKAAALAAELRLDWQSKVDEEFAFYTNGRDSEYGKILEDYFEGDKKLFIKYVVEPAAIEASLKTYFNSDYGVNRDLYDKAQNILEQVLNGGNFEELAKLESDDEVSAQFGGDLGFFNESELLPELEAQIQKGPMGEIQRKVFVSRLGYHVIWPIGTAEESGNRLWHVKHILVRSQGFDEWLTQETANIKVRKLGRD
ncbi:MAG: peptidylprolyl isomerase [Candidatus Doudnabacteria bacterium]|nr:peptidylprolyl isomerase [Candidatus Doudnabacteria bacterium]